jgi:hypothetical protein
VESVRLRTWHVKAGAAFSLAALTCALVIAALMPDASPTRGALEGPKQLTTRAGPVRLVRPSRPSPAASLLGRIHELRSQAQTVELQRRRVALIRGLARVPGAEARLALQALAYESPERFERLAAINVMWVAGQEAELEKRAESSDDALLVAKLAVLKDRSKRLR